MDIDVVFSAFSGYCESREVLIEPGYEIIYTRAVMSYSFLAEATITKHEVQKDRWWQYYRAQEIYNSPFHGSQKRYIPSFLVAGNQKLEKVNHGDQKQGSNWIMTSFCSLFLLPYCFEYGKIRTNKLPGISQTTSYP
jgi:hypothetical protein